MGLPCGGWTNQVGPQAPGAPSSAQILLRGRCPARCFFTAGMAVMLQHFIDAARVRAEARSDAMLVFAIPMAAPDFDSIFKGKAICRFVLVQCPVSFIGLRRLDNEPIARMDARVLPTGCKSSKSCSFSIRSRGCSPGFVVSAPMLSQRHSKPLP